MNIIVTGGAGFIASHVVSRYIDLGHKVAIVDNLSTGRAVTGLSSIMRISATGLH